MTGHPSSGPGEPSSGPEEPSSGPGQLTLAGMPERLVRVTPSRLAAWDDCPRRYRLTRLDEPAPARGGPWAHSTLGAVVHGALRALFALPVPGRSPERAAALVDRYWSSEGFRDDEQADRYRERARGWAAGYAATTEVARVPLGLERWVSAPVGTVVAEGRVDRIDDRDGEAVVVDYKTGRGVPDAAAARSSTALAVYAMAAQPTLRRRCRRVELHHLPSGHVAAAEHDAASLRAHRSRVEASAAALTGAADALAAGGDPDGLFPARPAPRCGHCQVRRHCPPGRAAAPARASWELLAP